MLRLSAAIAALFIFLLAETPPAEAQNADSAGATGLPVPRFVTIRANKVNLRTGPGVRYPIDWEYRQAGLPVEIVGEYGTWRKVRDWQGDEGWMHQSMLSGRRSFMVRGDVGALRETADRNARLVARLEAGVVGRIAECPATGGWCKVEVEGFAGWLERERMWGIYPDELIEP
ncbi:MAG: SH3 domain-containing protein [Rhodospirillales bacterium]